MGLSIVGLSTATMLPSRADIKIGELAPMSGGVSQYGTATHHGVTMAFDDANKSGGVLGQKLQLITEDTQSKSGQSSVSIRKLINQDKVLAVIGDTISSLSLEAAPIAQESKIPMVSPSATNPKVTEVGNEIFRVCFLDELQGRVAARFVLQKLKQTKVMILTDVKQDYSVDLAKFFKDEFTKGGGKIVGEQSYASGDTDFRAQLTSIKASSPQVIFVPGYYSEVALAIKQGRQIGIKVPFVGCDGWANQALLDVGGKALDGCYFTNHFAPDDPNPVVKQFVDAYKAKYGTIPDTFAALGYDDARLMIDAIKRAGSPNSQAIRNALASTKNFPGVTGEITMRPDRNASKPGFIIRIQDGKFHVAEKIKAQNS
jgi:branched-chain amino acid transport system substrate-binding protein